MKLDVLIGGRKRSVELAQQDGKFRCTLDGQPVAFDTVEVAEGTYSILIDGLSYEVRVYRAPDGLHITAGGEEFVAQ
ncbi:MAG TPA: hypothetical protein VNL38_00090, partial [Candidatus Nitrosotenuis sp.]|nr:hypothetical protein [Candidatus Nitrosotenuis sp.]